MLWFPTRQAMRYNALTASRGKIPISLIFRATDPHMAIKITRRNLEGTGWQPVCPTSETPVLPSNFLCSSTISIVERPEPKSMGGITINENDTDS